MFQTVDHIFTDNNLEQRDRYKCPKCHYLLKDAVQVSCGHWMCLECAKDIFEENSSPFCPRQDCKEALELEDGKLFFPDKFVRKEINKFQVRCRNYRNDCPWNGTLIEIIKHMEVCIYEQSECPHCNEMMSAAKYGHHVAMCPKAITYCPFVKFGCGYTNEMTRAECDKHLALEVVTHSKIVAKILHSFSPDNEYDEKLLPPDNSKTGSSRSVETDGKTNDSFRGRGRLNHDVQCDGPPQGAVGGTYSPQSKDLQHIGQSLTSLATKLEVEALRRELSQKDSKIQHLLDKLQRVESTVQAKSSENEDRDFRLSLMENSNFDGSMVWKIPQFSQRMEDARTGKYTSIFSLPFYSARYGYKMCLRLYILGDGIGKGSHMSLFFVLMKGEFDNILQWPFTHKVTFKLINQCGGRDIVDIFQPDPLSSSFQKPKTDMNVASGCPRFVSLNELMQGGFILDDTVYIKVKADTTTMRHP